MGQLIRVLIILAAVWLIWHYVRRALSRRVKPPAPPPSSTRMVACAVCGTHVPESEAVRAGGKAFCCEAHREMAEKGKRRA